MKIPFLSSLFLTAGALLTGGDKITQFATLDSLLAGVYDGHFSCADVLEAGNFGLGTFEAIDGEMLVIDGVIYQVLADGSVEQPNPETTRTPFAAVIDFEPEAERALENVEGLVALQELILAHAGNPNLPYAIRVEGIFNTVKTRSPRRQDPPYPLLEEVVRTQAVFDGENTRGVMVGFVLPQYMAGINAPGIHLHYLSDDHRLAGHVITFQLREGRVLIDPAKELEMQLPAESSAFRDAVLGVDRSQEMKAVEAQR